MKLQNFLTKSLRFLAAIYQHFFADGCTIRAAALTYTTLLSLVPLITVSFAIFSAFPAFKDLSVQIQNSIFENFIPSAGLEIQKYLLTFIEQAKNLSAIGSIFLVITAILMMFNMEQAFNAIWRVNARRRGFSTFMTYWAVLTLAPVLIGLSLVVGNYLTHLTLISAATQTFGMGRLFALIFPFILVTLAFFIFYVAIPNCYVPWKAAAIGAVAAGVLFELTKHAFGYYVRMFPTYTLIYGALAAIPIFLLWLYITWVIILFGAVLSHIIGSKHYYRSHYKMDGFTHAFRWLYYFWLAQKQNKSLTLNELVDADRINYQVSPQLQIQTMEQAGLITQGQRGQYLLSCNISELTVQNFHDLLPWRLPSNMNFQFQEEQLACEKKMAQTVLHIYELARKNWQTKIVVFFNDETEEKN